MDARHLGPMIDVRALLGPERSALVDLLVSLSPDQWAAPTACPAWSVHEVAVHLVHDDLRRLSAQRDGHPGPRIQASDLDGLVAGLDDINARWVGQVAPSVSPRLVLELLRWLAAPTEAYLAGLTPEATGDRVAWAGPGPHPNWLDVAREFTERWVHQQQIRAAVGCPGLTAARFLEPVVDTFVRALPAALPARPEGTEVELRVTGEVRRTWSLRSTGGSPWHLVATGGREPAAVVELPADVVWRRAVRMVDHDEVRLDAEVEGDPDLAAAILDLRGAIVPDGVGGSG